MSKRRIFQSLAGPLVPFCIIIMIISFFNLKYCRNPYEQQIQSTSVLRESSKNTKHTNEANNSTTEMVRQVGNRLRKIIRDDLEGYQYPNGKYNISARNLEDLLIEKNGRPIRSIIVTTWRSGSTFLGDIINAHPGDLHFFEPLLDFGIVTIRGSDLAEGAMDRVTALLNCDYADRDKYMKHVMSHHRVITANEHLWEQCQGRERSCFNRTFLSAMCKLFPFQSMKLTRLRLSVSQGLLADEEIAARMVLLVRDPRGTMQSRKRQKFCQQSPDCSDPAFLCADLVSNYKIAVNLQKRYPTRFRVIRYEDLAGDPYAQAEELLKFFGRDFHPNVIKFLDTHTHVTVDSNEQFSTFRNSKTTPYHWKTDLEFEEVETIQRACAGAMEYWGYLPAMNATHQREFNPVTDYAL